MPVRSLSLSIFKWPDAEMVKTAVHHWAAKAAQACPDVVRLGYLG
jgi:hypothetical protein